MKNNFVLAILIMISVSCKQNLESEFKDAEFIDLQQYYLEQSSDTSAYNKMKELGFKFESDTLIIPKDRIKPDKSKLPKCTRVIKRPNKIHVQIEGLDFFLKDKKLIGIGKLDISNETLSAITERFAILDNFQFSCCQDLNREYMRVTPSNDIIKYLLEKKYTIWSNFTYMIDLLKRNVNKPNPDTAIMEGMNVVSERIEEL